MAEYIERDKLLRDINHYHLSDGKFQHWVEVQQAADVVPVVRCKDCGNFRQNVHGVCWCDEYGGSITPEDYCSRAVTDKPSRVKIPWEAD